MRASPTMRLSESITYTTSEWVAPSQSENVRLREISKENKFEPLEITPSIDEPVHVVKEGWMRKQSRFIKNWKQRYFVLMSDGVCKYYRNDFHFREIDCKGYIRIKRKSWTDSVDKRYGIKMYTARRNWRFVCADERDRAEWIEAFELVHQ